SMAPTFSLLLLTTSICMGLLLALLRLLGLGDLDFLRRERLANDHVAGWRARNAALDDEEVVLGVDAQHLQVVNGGPRSAHPAARSAAGRPSCSAPPAACPPWPDAPRRDQAESPRSRRSAPSWPAPPRRDPP